MLLEQVRVLTADEIARFKLIFLSNINFRLVLTPSGKYVKAELVHFTQGSVIEASTQEWAIKKQLYKTNDTSAYINLARVFAQRCIESGFFEMDARLGRPEEGTKVDLFMKTLEKNGLLLQEPWFVKPEGIANRFVGKTTKPYRPLEDDSRVWWYHKEHEKN